MAMRELEDRQGCARCPAPACHGMEMDRVMVAKTSHDLLAVTVITPNLHLPSAAAR